MIIFNSKDSLECTQCSSRVLPFYANEYGFHYCLECCIFFEILDLEHPEEERTLGEKLASFVLRFYVEGYDEID